jgi:hypothetical protein
MLVRPIIRKDCNCARIRLDLVLLTTFEVWKINLFSLRWLRGTFFPLGMLLFSYFFIMWTNCLAYHWSQQHKKYGFYPQYILPNSGNLFTLNSAISRIINFLTDSIYVVLLLIWNNTYFTHCKYYYERETSTLVHFFWRHNQKPNLYFYVY